MRAPVARVRAAGAALLLLQLAVLGAAAGIGCEDFGDPVQPENGGPVGPRTLRLTPVKDNTLYEDPTGRLSNGSGTGLFVGTVSGLGGFRKRRALLAFDLADSIPAGATIESVRLVLRMSRTVSGAKPVALHSVQSDWGEGSSAAPQQDLPRQGGGQGAPAAAGEATWVHRFFDTVSWTAAGGDFATTPSASIQVAGPDTYTWGPTAAMVADVQSWLDDPARNFGWILVGEESGIASAKRFDSREQPTADFRPQLVVEYSLPPLAAREAYRPSW